MFQFPTFAPFTYVFSKGYPINRVGFPIRISPDQSLFDGSPKLFAVYNVLHRLWLPRHPPHTLKCLTI